MVEVIELEERFILPARVVWSINILTLELDV